MTTLWASTSSWVARLAMLVSLAAGLLPAGRFVICIDGRWSVALEEATDDGACSDCTESSACAEPAAEHDDADCGCIDLLVAEPEEDQVVPLTPVRLPPAIALAGVPYQPLPRVAGTSADRLREPPRPPRSLEALRTVVLRV